jgi:hypothetical protein
VPPTGRRYRPDLPGETGGEDGRPPPLRHVSGAPPDFHNIGSF